MDLRSTGPTGLLLIGASTAEARGIRAAVLARLATINSNRSLVLEVEASIVIVSGELPMDAYLDVVYLFTDSTYPLGNGVLARRCEELAEMLAGHPRSPWVSFGDNPELDPLVDIFKNVGVRVERGRQIADVLCDRFVELEAERQGAQGEQETLFVPWPIAFNVR